MLVYTLVTICLIFVVFFSLTLIVGLTSDEGREKIASAFGYLFSFGFVLTTTYALGATFYYWLGIPSTTSEQLTGAWVAAFILFFLAAITTKRKPS